MKLFLIFNLIFAACEINANSLKKNRIYRPDINDLNDRPLPEWYDRAKIGIFINWGVYSVPCFFRFCLFGDSGCLKERSEVGIWNSPNNNLNYGHMQTEQTSFRYEDLVPMFTAEFFDPVEWADLFQSVGAKYVILTTKHHDGYTLFPSNRPNRNSKQIGPKRDIVLELSHAVQNKSMRFGAYYSVDEWFNPSYKEDQKHLKEYNYKRFIIPEILKIVNDYKPSFLWLYGDWKGAKSYRKFKLLIAWLYNRSPVKDEIVFNYRGKLLSGERYRREKRARDSYDQGYSNNQAILPQVKWENVFTLDRRSWGYRCHMSDNDVLTTNELLYKVVSTVSRGGNAVINIGPTKDGIIVPVFRHRLLTLGQWLSVNGEAIYGSSPWFLPMDPINQDVWYTCKKKKYNSKYPAAAPNAKDKVLAVYAIFLSWPKNDVIMLTGLAMFLKKDKIKKYGVKLLGYNGSIKWEVYTVDIVVFYLPHQELVNSTHAWTLKITKLKNRNRKLS